MNSLNNKDLYIKALNALEKGNFETAAKLTALFRDPRGYEEGILHRLINIRLQLKIGNFDNDLNITPPKSTSLKAEYLFVLGLQSFNNSDWKQGAEYFNEASILYNQIEKFERKLLCQYNSLIGTINEKKYDQKEVIQDLLKLCLESKTVGTDRILGLAQRQLSYEYLSLNKFHASKKYALHAVENLSSGPKSDRDLALCTLAITNSKLQHMDESLSAIEEILDPVEPRVEWPLAVTKFLCGLTLKQPLKENFKTLDPFFESVLSAIRPAAKTQTSFKLAWDISTGLFRSSSGEELFKLRNNSLEHKLLFSLINKPCSKTLLIEMLYPGNESQELVNNRLHKLISRVNKRFPNIVLYRNSQYCLSTDLKVLDH